MDKEFISKVVDGLQNEALQLSQKLVVAEKKENYGTYKNIAQAFEKTLDLLSKYDVREVKIINLEEKVANEYYGNRDIVKILGLIEKEYNIYDSNDLSPEQEYKVYKLISKCLLNILKNEIKQDTYLNKCIIKNDENKVDFILYDKEGFSVKKDKTELGILNHYYKSVLSLELDNYNILLSISLLDLLNDDYNIFIFFDKVVNGYKEKLHKIRDNAISIIESSSKTLFIKDDYITGIGLGDNFLLKHNNPTELSINLKMGVCLIENNYIVEK